MNYDSVPRRLRHYLGVSPEDYNHSPPSVRELLLRGAEQDFLTDLARQRRREEQTVDAGDFDFHRWTWRYQYITRVLGRYEFEEFQRTGDCGISPAIIGAENANSFATTLDHNMYVNKPDENWHCHQITLVTNHGYLNASPGNLLARIMDRLEDYDEHAFEVYELVGRYTSPEHRRAIMRRTVRDVAAGQGKECR